MVKAQRGVFALGALVVICLIFGPLCICIGMSLLGYRHFFIRKKADAGEGTVGKAGNGGLEIQNPVNYVDEDSSLSD